MHHQRVAGGQLREQVLGAAVKPGHGPALEAAAEAAGKRRAQIGAPELDSLDSRAGHDRRQLAPDDLDFGQLRHGELLDQNGGVTAEVWRAIACIHETGGHDNRLKSVLPGLSRRMIAAPYEELEHVCNAVVRGQRRVNAHRRRPETNLQGLRGVRHLRPPGGYLHLHGEEHPGQPNARDQTALGRQSGERSIPVRVHPPQRRWSDSHQRDVRQGEGRRNHGREV